MRRYLREFLGDPRVLEMPAPLRTALLYGVILPFRPRRSAAAYRQIWGPAGSPLLVHGLALRDALRVQLGGDYAVELGMRYGAPSLISALDLLLETEVESVFVVPLFPHYATATTGSSLAALYNALAARRAPPPVAVLPSFFRAAAYIDCLATCIRELPGAERSEHLLISYHGLPEQQIRDTDPSGAHCLASPDCCELPTRPLARCYRAQCLETARHLAAAAGLAPGSWSLAFQSRLGRQPWLKPYTDDVLVDLAGRGVRRLAVSCPSFAADCLETLEEIGIRARAQWRQLGGEELWLVPALNAHPRWVHTLATWIRGSQR